MRPSERSIMYPKETNITLFNPMLSNLDFRIFCSQNMFTVLGNACME